MTRIASTAGVRRKFAGLLVLVAVVASAMGGASAAETPGGKATASQKATSKKRAAKARKPTVRGKVPRAQTTGGKAAVSRTKTAKAKGVSRSRVAAARRAPRVTAMARAASVEWVSETVAREQNFDSPGALAPFFERLYELRQRPAAAVHVLHYGDSHTASDDWAAVMRDGFQSRFGNGGSGYSMPGRPFLGYRRYDLRSGGSSGWITEGTVAHRGDEMHGLSGISIHTTRRNEYITLGAIGEEAELWFLRQPGGGSVSVKLDGSDQGETSTAGELGPGMVKFNVSPGKHQLEARTTSYQPVRLLGTVMEENGGVTWETLGINGAQISMLNDLAEQVLGPNVAARDPAMIVFAYGTNEANSPRWSPAEYEASVRAVLKRFRAMAPAATLLLVGPPDCRIRSQATLAEVIEIQRKVAAEVGAAYWDWRARMGGPGAIRTWVSAGYAQGDFVHLTTAGYQLLGRTLFGDLMAVYDHFVQARAEVANGGSK